MAENMIKFLRGNVASLPQTATEGALYFTKDEGLYLGLADGSYHRYGDFITVDDVASLPAAGAHETCMYYCVAENILAKWSGSEWIQINKQKTLAELGGVAKSVYETKMAALEQADTDNSTAISNLETYVGTIPETASATDIVGYVQEKTSGIATDTALTELTGRVATAEGKLTTLTGADTVEGSVAKALKDAKAEASRLDLKMQLVDSEFTFDRKQLYINFVSDERVDFRELVKFLAGKYKTRIELHQMGARDKAKQVGGIGVCGRKLCCSNFSNQFDSITMNMAKDQNLALNPSKINGCCGRLLCCLAYEYDYYVEEKAAMPAEGSKIKINHELFKVSEVNILSRRVSLQGADGRVLYVPFDDVYYNDESQHWCVSQEWEDEIFSS